MRAKRPVGLAFLSAAVPRVRPGGRTSAAAVFRRPSGVRAGRGESPAHPVPTSVARGPDGALCAKSPVAAKGPASGDPTGALHRTKADGTRTLIARDGLFTPAGVTAGPDGAYNVSGKGTPAGSGEVVRIRG
jgi:hypothetical protein